MLVNKTNRNFVHHLLGYECKEDFVPPDNAGGECGAVLLKPEVEAGCRQKLFVAWGVGGQYVIKESFY